MIMERKDGYYWVKFTEKSEWSIAEWLDGYWYFPRQVSAKYDGDFYEIINEKIKPPITNEQY